MCRYVDSQWTDFYNNDPQNFTGSPAQLQRMLGGHVCVWDDAANSDGSNLVQVMYPPTSAAAEVLWSPRAFTTGVCVPQGRQPSPSASPAAPPPPPSSFYLHPIQCEGLITELYKQQCACLRTTQKARTCASPAPPSTLLA